MEFNLSGFFTGVGIDVLDLDGMRNILNNLDDSVKFIDFHNINDFLLEEFSQSSIHLFIKFRIFAGEFPHLDSK